MVELGSMKQQLPTLPTPMPNAPTVAFAIGLPVPVLAWRGLPGVLANDCGAQVVMVSMDAVEVGNV